MTAVSLRQHAEERLEEGRAATPQAPQHPVPYGQNIDPGSDSLLWRENSLLPRNFSLIPSKFGVETGPIRTASTTTHFS